MFAKPAFDLGLTNPNNLCCNMDCYQDGQVLGYRRNIYPKSAGKGEKPQKTSLKKRSGTCNSTQQTKQQTQNHEPKHQNTPPKPVLMHRIVKPPEPAVVFQQIQLASTPPPTANYIRYTPEKPRHQGKKINFIYNSKMPTTKYENLGVHDLESFKEEVKIIKNQNFESQKAYKTPATAFHSQTRIDPFKSTQYTNMASEKVGSWDQSPGLSRHFNFDPVPPLTSSDRRQSKAPLTSLSSRKQTVLSINGDSQSQESIALQDLHPLPMAKFNSIQTSKIAEDRNKFVDSSLKSSLNF